MSNDRFRYSEQTVRHFERERDRWRAAAYLGMTGTFGTIIFFTAMIWSGCP